MDRSLVTGCRRCWSDLGVLCGEEMLTEGDSLPGRLEVGCTCGGCPAEILARLLASAWVALAPPLVQGCLHPHPCNTGAPAGPSSLLGTTAISPWEGGGYTLDCAQGSRANVLQAGAGGSGHGAQLAVGRTHGIARSHAEAPCWHLPSASEETPADAAGLLSRDYWAAAEASPGCFI